MISDRSLRLLLRSDRSVRVWGGPVRIGIAVAVLILLLLWLLYHAAIVRVMMGKLHLNDFGKFYYSAQYFLAGQDMYAPSPATTLPAGDTTHDFLNMNPPHFHLLILPLTPLSPASALAVWAVMGLSGLLWSTWLVTRELRLKWTGPRVIWATLAMLACSSTSAVIMTGQLTFQLLPLITLAWIAARHRSWIRAGVWLGIVAAVKPNLGLLGLCLIVAGQWGAAIAMASTVAASFAVGLLIFGWDAHKKWMAALNAVDWMWAPMNGSLAGLFTRVFQGGASVAPTFAAPQLILPATLLASFAVAGISMRQIARRRPHVPVDHFFAIGILGAQLISPLGWVYYLWFAVGPLLAIWIGAEHTPGLKIRTAVLAAFCLAIPGLLWQLPMFSAVVHEWWQPLTFRSIYTWTTLWLWVAVVVDAVRVTSRVSLARDSPSGS